MEPGFKRAAWVKESIVAGNGFHAMKQDPARHNALNVASLLGVVLAFCGLIALGGALPAWLYIPLAAPLFGSMFFSGFILVIHECSHNMFLLFKDRERIKGANRLIGKIAGWVLFTDYIRHWEGGHTTHHLRPCEPDDPQDANPLTGAELWPMYWRLLIPGYFMVLNPSRRYPGALGRAVVGLLIWGPILTLTGLYVSWAVPVAMGIGFHVLAALNMSKKAQEHGCGLAHEADPMLRSRTYFYPLQVIFSPFNINYHFEHHANFNVPWYRLPDYHKAVIKLVFEPVKRYYFHHDYLAQLSGKKPLPPDELRPLLQG